MPILAHGNVEHHPPRSRCIVMDLMSLWEVVHAPFTVATTHRRYATLNGTAAQGLFIAADLSACKHDKTSSDSSDCTLKGGAS